MNKIRILHLLQSNRFSGAENVVCQIIKMFATDDNVDMVYSSADGQIRQALEERNICFVPMNKLSYREVRRVIYEVQPDIIHAHDMKASFFAALAGRGRRVISHIHNNSFMSRGITVKTLAYRLVSNKFSYIFWVSNSAYEGYYFKKSIESKSEVLCNIIDVNELQEKAEKDKKLYDYDIIYLGRFSEPKNPLRIVKVIGKVVAKQKKVKAVLIGTGELEQEVRDCVKQLGLENNIDMMGYVNNPYKILASSKVMLMTSLWEGTPMCTLEAMSLGVPIVSTPTDGIVTIVEHDVTGYLADDDLQIAEYCLSIINNDDIREKMSANSKQKAMKMMCISTYKEKIEKQYLHYEGREAQQFIS